jgi:serine/threonine protein kinase
MSLWSREGSARLTISGRDIPRGCSGLTRCHHRPAGQTPACFTACENPSYLAPEVVQNNMNRYGHGVDSWSVGVNVFSMLVPIQNEAYSQLYTTHAAVITRSFGS